MSGFGLSRARAALLVVDIQDRLVPAMPADVAARVIQNTAILIDAAARLGLPIIVSQQYPQGLGATVRPIEDALAAAASQHGADVRRFDKIEFSAAGAIEPSARDQLIIVGMEAHVCVYQTARDLAARGDNVHVVSDAICSRTKANWLIGVDLVAYAGGIPTSTEVCVFDLLGRAGSDDFKALSRAIR